MRQRACPDGEGGAPALNGDSVAAADVAAHGFASGENIEVHITGKELSNLKGLRGSDRKGCAHGSAAGCAELIEENVFRTQPIRKLFTGSERIRLRDIRLNDCARRKR